MGQVCFSHIWIQQRSEYLHLTKPAWQYHTKTWHLHNREETESDDVSTIILLEIVI